MALKQIAKTSPDISKLSVISLIVHIESSIAARICLLNVMCGTPSSSYACVSEWSGFTLMFPHFRKTTDDGIAQGDKMPCETIITVFHYGTLDDDVRAELNAIQPGLADKFLAQ